MVMYEILYQSLKPYGNHESTYSYESISEARADAIKLCKKNYVSKHKHGFVYIVEDKSWDSRTKRTGYETDGIVYFDNDDFADGGLGWVYLKVRKKTANKLYPNGKIANFTDPEDIRKANKTDVLNKIYRK